MITRAALDSLRVRTCAIGLLEVPVEEYTRNPQTRRFAIFGTGFLIGPRLVLTNAHVLGRLDQEREKRALPKNRRHVAFYAPREQGFELSFHEFEKAGSVVSGPKLATPGRLDLGLVSFKAVPESQMDSLSAVTVCDRFNATVGQPIAVYGYPFGTDLLTGEGDVLYRFGPVLQQGYISAIAPYEHSPQVDRLLLDVRTTNGMSGSPVFDPETGCVLAVHQAGIASVIAFGIPLDSQTVSDLIAIQAAAPEEGFHEGEMSPIRRSSE